MVQTKEGAIKINANKLGISVEEYKKHQLNGEKWCYKCQMWRATSQFNVDRSRGDGLTSRCVICRRVKEHKSTKGRISTFKGKHHSPEAKAKLSQASTGNTRRVGKTHTLESRIKMSRALRERSLRGEQCHSYKDGKLIERRGIRFSQGYKRWRFDVFTRDRFTCQECGDNRGGNLIAHHIKPFAEYPNLRLDLDNGLTLCRTCHDNLHYKTKETI